MIFLRKIITHASFRLSGVALLGLISGVVFRGNSLHQDKESVSAIEASPSLSKRFQASKPEHKSTSLSFYKSSSLNVQKTLARLYKNEDTLDWNKEIENLAHEFCCSPHKEEVYIAFFSLWVKHDFKAAITTLETMYYSPAVRDAVLSYYARNYPKEAFNAATKDIFFTNTSLMIKESISVLAKQDPHFLFKLYQEVGNDHILAFQHKGLSLREHLLHSIFDEIGYTDPQVIEYINAYHQKHDRIPQKVFIQWAGQDYLSAESWVKQNSLTEDSYYKNNLFIGVALNNVEEAKRIFALATENEKKDYLYDVQYRIGESATSLDCILNLMPDHELTPSHLKEMSYWVQAEPEKALQWIQTLSASNAKDIAIDYFVNGYVESYRKISNNVPKGDPS